MITINKTIFRINQTHVKNVQDAMEYLVYCSNLTQKIFAERCRLTEYQFRKLKKHQHYRDFHSERMNRIAKATGVRVEWINNQTLPVFEEEPTK